MAVTLVGNWSWTVWLLVPAALALAVLTAASLGSRGEAPAAARRRGGVGRVLTRAAETESRA